MIYREMKDEFDNKDASLSLNFNNFTYERTRYESFQKKKKKAKKMSDF